MSCTRTRLRGFRGVAAALAWWLSLQAALVLTLNAQTPVVPTNILRSDFWDTDGTVNALLATNGRVYVGGDFSYVAPKGRKLAAYDLHTGALDAEFPKIFGASIDVIIEDGQGGWFVGGNFREAGGLPRTNLVHILSNNTVDPDFVPQPDGVVRALALDDTKLFVGGDFTHIQGQPRQRIAALDLTDHFLFDWAPEANLAVAVILVSDGVVYVGGHFTQIGGATRKNIAALDPVSGNALGWNPEADGDVLTLGLVNERLFAGGSFNFIGGQPRNGLAALDVRTNNALPWNPNPNGGKVTALRVTCDTVYVGGYFTNIAGVARARLAAVDAYLGQALPWNPNLGLLYSGNLPSAVFALEVYGNAVYVGGEFATASGLVRRDLLAVDAASGQLLAWDPQADGGVTALGVAGRKVLAGFVNSPGGVARQNLAAFDEATGKALDWNPAASGAVSALALAGNRIFAGGSFTNVGGLTRHRLAAIDATSGQVETNWSANANNSVSALATDGNTLYVGGSFTIVNGSTAQRLCALDANNGSLRTNWVAHADGTVHTLALGGTILYAGGAFTTVAAGTRRGAAALHATTAQLQPWDPNANFEVRSLVVVGSMIYAGGAFTTLRGNPHNYLAALDAVSGVAAPWDVHPDEEVRALAASGDAIYFGGTFLQAGGQERFGCAAIDLNGQLLDWNPGTSEANRVYSLAFSDQVLYAGGTDQLQFRSSVSLHSLGAFPRAGAPILTQTPIDQEAFASQTVLFQAQASGQQPLSYQWRFGNSAVPDATNAMLILSNVQPAHAGTYQLTVSNSLGRITAEASLTLLQVVAISAQPVVSPSNTPGTTVTLNVSATGTPPPLYQWRLNGVNIPGAVFPTLTLSNVAPADGGSYHVVVANRFGALNSEVAEVVVSAPALPFANDLAQRGNISSLSGTGGTNNFAATTETFEPRHVGKAGGKSVWVGWTARTNGIATFSTRGSSFDTLLAVYTGTAMTNLELVASDEDRGGFLTSRASFNASAGTEYLIAIDGLAGSDGHIIFDWFLDTISSPVPRILSQPLSASVPRGSNVTFTVTATNSTAATLSYQWFFGCQEIPGATNASLTVSNVQSRKVGAYSVVVMNAGNRAESLPAALEIGPDVNVLSFDKLEDALAHVRIGNVVAPSSSAQGGGLILVSMGTIVSQTFDTSPNHNGPREPNHCGIIGGVSTWLIFQPLENGLVEVETSGSSFDTVLAVYYSTSLGVIYTNTSAAVVACDDNSAPDGVRSRVVFPGRGGTTYLAVVDGVGGKGGTAMVHWQLGNRPDIVAPTSNVTARIGAGLTLHAGVTSRTFRTSYVWFHNGATVPGATTEVLTLTNLTFGLGGTYSVIVSNFAGMETNVAANVTPGLPVHFSSSVGFTGGRFHCQITGNPNELFALQTSSNLSDWATVWSGHLPGNELFFVDTNSLFFPHRFYRVILPGQ